MPGGDRTGPMGAGPRTGRGLGYCSGADDPGWTRGGVGRGGFGLGRGGFGRGGFGFGRGRCRGWGRWGGWFGPAAGMDPEDERGALEQERAALERRLGSVNRVLSREGDRSGSEQE